MERLPSETLAETESYNSERRLYDDTTTWFAEMLRGQMRTPFEYTFDGREFYGQDGSSIRDIITKGFEDSERLPSNLSFEKRRRQAELNEYADMVAMMNSADHNTIVVVSDFPAELMDATENVGGYNVTRKQTMLRVLTKTEQGTLKIRTQTLDMSNRGALEDIYRKLGASPCPGELLDQRIHLNLDSESQEFLVDALTGIYDRRLSLQFGGEWYAGRKEGKRINTYDFVRAQGDLLAAYIQSVQKHGENPQLLYDIAATMEKRYESIGQNQTIVDAKLFIENPNIQSQLINEIATAGQSAALAGKTFDGCGMSIGRDDMSTEDQLRLQGLGNKTDEKTEYKFDKKMHCVVCQAPPKDKEGKKMCGPCGICRTCDIKLK